MDLPGDLTSRPGWTEWSARHDVRLWHHATDVDAPFTIFCRQDEASIGFHFGSHPAARERHAIMHRMVDPAIRRNLGFMIPVLVRFRNPLRMHDKLCWDLDRVTSDLVAKNVIDEATEETILIAADTQALFAAIELAGHDAILYPNETEGVHDDQSESVLVWRASAIRSVHCVAFVDDDPRLCPSMTPNEEDVSWWRSNEDGIDRWIRALARTGRIAE